MAARAVVEAPVGLELLVGERGGNAPERLLVEVPDGRRGLRCDELPQAAREHRWWLLPLHKQHQGDGPRRAGQGALAELDDVAELLLRSQRVEKYGLEQGREHRRQRDGARPRADGEQQLGRGVPFFRTDFFRADPEHDGRFR